MDSILTSIKKLLGIQEEYTVFDADIMIHINTAFAILNQLGVGPAEGFMIEGPDEVWDEYIEDYNFAMVKSFIYIQVRLAFDPPTSTALLESMKRTLDELTWRLEVEGQNGTSDQKGGDTMDNLDKITYDEIKHHGIKGQKWGVRRYQNEDGSLTNAGKKRYGTQENFEKQYPIDKKKSDISTINSGREAARNAKEVNRNLKELEREKTSKKQKIANKQIEEAARDNARRMSDQELREAVNRLNMEENYTRMMANRNYIDAGESAASKFMDRASKALVVTEAALSIALIVRQLKSQEVIRCVIDLYRKRNYNTTESKDKNGGVRRYQNKDGSLTADGRKRYADSIADTKVYTKKGVEVTLRKQPTPLLAKSINVVQKYEGNGYGKTVMQAVKDHAKKLGLEKVTLEVPGISPNARHIYESLGFKSKGQISDDDDSWGGLTAMELDLTKE